MPGDVAIRGPDGEIQLYSPNQVNEALAAGGEIASPEDVARQKLQAEYGTFGGELTTGAIGAASGVSFGLSDEAIAKLGGREELQKYYQANPTARTAGEVGGIAASLLVPGLGEENLLARAARVPTALPRVVSRAGRAAEEAAAGTLAREGAGVAERAAVKGLSSGVGGALEGSAYGIGHEISDAAIEDHELTAEKLLAGAKHGALWGGGIGASLGVGGELASSGLSGALKRFSESNESLAEVLDRKSGEFAFRSAGGGKALAKSADKAGEGYAEMGKIWRDDAPSLVGKSSFKEMSQEDLRLASRLGSEREGQILGVDLAKMTEHATARGTLPNAMGVVDGIEEVARKVNSRAGQETAAARIQDFADSVKRISGLVDSSGNYLPDAASKTISFEALRDFRVDADNKWRGARRDPSLTGATKFFGQVRDELERKVMLGAEEAGVARSYKSAKVKYQAFDTLKKAAEGGVASQGSNRVYSLMDSQLTKMGSGAGAVVGGFAAGPVGAAAGALLGGLAGGAASKFVRSRGDFLAADLLHSIGQMGGIERMSQSVDNQIRDGISSFMNKSKRIAIAETAKTRAASKTSLARTQAIVSAVGSPEIVQRRVHDFLGNTGDVAPNITSRVAMKVANGYAYLASQMPKARGISNSITPQFDKPRMSSYELSKAAKILDAVENPLSVLEDMKSGELSREKIRAIQVVYPKLFERIQSEVNDQAVELQKQLSYEQKLQLEILVGVPTDPTLRASFIADIQSSKQGTEQPQVDKPVKEGKPGTRRPIKIDSEQYETNPTQLH